MAVRNPFAAHEKLIRNTALANGVASESVAWIDRRSLAHPEARFIVEDNATLVALLQVLAKFEQTGLAAELVAETPTRRTYSFSAAS